MRVLGSGARDYEHLIIMLKYLISIFSNFSKISPYNNYISTFPLTNNKTIIIIYVFVTIEKINNTVHIVIHNNNKYNIHNNLFIVLLIQNYI